MSGFFEAYITNLGKYNEGALVGEYLKFPTTTEEVQALLKRIGIDGVRYEEIFITDYDGDMPELYANFGEYESIDELNYLASLLSEMDENDLEVGTTPAAWNAGVFSLIQQLSETVILPIAGMVLTFVATYELIQMLLEKNNMHEVDVANIYKWMFKTAIAILILSNTFNIVMAVFDVSQSVISSAAGLIQGSTDISADMLANLETTLEGMGVGELLGLFMQSILIQVCMFALNIIIFVIVYGRMLEIYLMTSLAPIPVATLSNRELGSMGQNYIKSLFAVGFQGLLILVCVAIYAVLVQGIATSGDPIGAVWGAMGYTVLLCFMLFKTGSIAKSIFGAH